MSTNDRRVLVLIDVDGVLNLDGPVAGSSAHEIHVPAADVPPTTFVRTDDAGDVHLTAHLLPALHGPWITALRERADVRLASTWENSFNGHLAPLLGIEPLPLGIGHALVRPKFSMRDPVAWKTFTIRDLYDGRPLVFIDDGASQLIPHAYTEQEIAYAAEHGFEYEDEHPWRNDPTLVIAPDPAVGLTAQDMARVDAFVSEHA